MSKPVPPIQKYMTTNPETVSPLDSIASAAKLMRTAQVRHLPVVEGTRVVGLLSERDIALVEGLVGVDATKLSVKDAMAREPYTVSPDAPLTEVAQAMAGNKYGSAIVVQNGKVVGIFTTVDACKVLVEVFETRLR
jgi:acetoin utilization protein AcuB